MNKVRGFSVLEILVAAGIMGVLVAGISIALINMQKSQNRVDAKMEIMGLLSQIQTITSASISCGAAFSGQTFNPTFAKSNQGSSATLNLNQNGTYFKLTPGEPIPNHNLKMEKLAFRDAQDAGQSSAGNPVFRVNLVGIFSPTKFVSGKDMFGERLISSMFVEVEKDNIIGCSNLNVNDPVSMEQLCQTLGGQWRIEMRYLAGEDSQQGRCIGLSGGSSCKYGKKYYNHGDVIALKEKSMICSNGEVYLMNLNTSSPDGDS